MSNRNRRPPRPPVISPKRLPVPSQIVTYRRDGTTSGAGIYRSSASRSQIDKLAKFSLTPMSVAYERALRAQRLTISKAQTEARYRVKQSMGSNKPEPYTEKFTAWKSAVAVNSFGALSGGTRTLGPSLLFKSLKGTKEVSSSLKYARSTIRNARAQSDALVKERLTKAQSLRQVKLTRDLQARPAASRYQTTIKQLATKQPTAKSSPSKESVTERLRRRRFGALKVAERERER